MFQVFKIKDHDQPFSIVGGQERRVEGEEARVHLDTCWLLSFYIVPSVIVRRNHFPLKCYLGLNEREGSQLRRGGFGGRITRSQTNSNSTESEILTGKLRDCQESESELCIGVRAAVHCPGLDSPPVIFINWLSIYWTNTCVCMQNVVQVL